MFKYVLHVWGEKLQRISHPTKYFGLFLSFRGSDPCFGLVSAPYLITCLLPVVRVTSSMSTSPPGFFEFMMTML